MARSVQAIVKPELLRWARDTAGFSVEAGARKAHIKPARLEGWERGEAGPSVAQLRKLAKEYKRPLGAFYLPEVPDPLPALRDFRRPHRAAHRQSPQLRLAYRQAMYRRQVALELFELLGETVPPFALSAELRDDPERLARDLRGQLGITSAEQGAWGDHYDALKAWRSACEDAGALVCHAVRVDPGEMSGFSISEAPLPVVVLNIKELPQRRIFTMLHETVHLATGQGGLCDLDEPGGRETEEQRTEVFCNHAAGAILVPMDVLRNDQLVRSRAAGPTWSDTALKALSWRFKVSREVVLRRLLVAGMTTREFYADKREELLTEYREVRVTPGRGGPNPRQAAISAAGPWFAKVVLHAYHLHRVTASDVAEYLGLRVRHLPKLEEELFRAGGPPRARPRTTAEDGL